MNQNNESRTIFDLREDRKTRSRATRPGPEWNSQCMGLFFVFATMGRNGPLLRCDCGPRCLSLSLSLSFSLLASTAPFHLLQILCILQRPEKGDKKRETEKNRLIILRKGGLESIFPPPFLRSSVVRFATAAAAAAAAVMVLFSFSPSFHSVGPRFRLRFTCLHLQ